MQALVWAAQSCSAAKVQCTAALISADLDMRESFGKRRPRHMNEQCGVWWLCIAHILFGPWYKDFVLQPFRSQAIHANNAGRSLSPLHVFASD